MSLEFGAPNDLDVLREILQKHMGEESSVTEISPVGNGFHAAGYRVMVEGTAAGELFLRVINPLEFGHDLPSDRLRGMLEAAEPLPRSLPVGTVLGINRDSQTVDLSGLREAFSLGELLPVGAVNLCSELRQPVTSPQEAALLAEQLRPKALLIAQAMAEIHAIPFPGDARQASSLYKRATRAVIHDS